MTYKINTKWAGPSDGPYVLLADIAGGLHVADDELKAQDPTGFKLAIEAVEQLIGVYSRFKANLVEQRLGQVTGAVPGMITDLVNLKNELEP